MVFRPKRNLFIRSNEADGSQEQDKLDLDEDASTVDIASEANASHQVVTTFWMNGDEVESVGDGPGSSSRLDSARAAAAAVCVEHALAVSMPSRSLFHRLPRGVKETLSRRETQSLAMAVALSGGGALAALAVNTLLGALFNKHKPKPQSTTREVKSKQVSFKNTANVAEEVEEVIPAIVVLSRSHAAPTTKSVAEQLAEALAQNKELAADRDKKVAILSAKHDAGKKEMQQENAALMKENQNQKGLEAQLAHALAQNVNSAATDDLKLAVMTKRQDALSAEKFVMAQQTTALVQEKTRLQEEKQSLVQELLKSEVAQKNAESNLKRAQDGVAQDVAKMEDQIKTLTETKSANAAELEALKLETDDSKKDSKKKLDNLLKTETKSAESQKELTFKVQQLTDLGIKQAQEIADALNERDEAQRKANILKDNLLKEESKALQSKRKEADLDRQVLELTQASNSLVTSGNDIKKERDAAVNKAVELNIKVRQMTEEARAAAEGLLEQHKMAAEITALVKARSTLTVHTDGLTRQVGELTKQLEDSVQKYDDLKAMHATSEEELATAKAKDKLHDVQLATQIQQNRDVARKMEMAEAQFKKALKAIEMEEARAKTELSKKKEELAIKAMENIEKDGTASALLTELKKIEDKLEQTENLLNVKSKLAEDQLVECNLHTHHYESEIAELKKKVVALTSQLDIKSMELDELKDRLARLLGDDLVAKEREVEEKARQLARSKAETEMLLERKKRVQAARAHTPPSSSPTSSKAYSSLSPARSDDAPAAARPALAAAYATPPPAAPAPELPEIKSSDNNFFSNFNKFFESPTMSPPKVVNTEEMNTPKK